MFEANDHFTDSILSKSYFLQNSSDSPFGDLLYDHAEGTSIHWKSPSKNLVVHTETKKQKHKGTGKTRIINKEIPNENSFFNFFSPPTPPPAESTEEENEEDMEELAIKMEEDYEVGEIIKEKIVTNAIDW